MQTEPTLDLIFKVIGLLGALFLFWFAIISLKEREKRAALVSAGLGIGIAATFFLGTLIVYSIQIVIFYVIVFLIAAFIILFILPIGKLPPDEHRPTRRVDERDIMFARIKLRPGTPAYDEYYSLHPEKQKIDDRTRSRPGLLSPHSKHAHSTAYAAAEASFHILDTLSVKVDEGQAGSYRYPLREMVDEGQSESNRQPLTAEEATHYLKSQARLYGALDVGITPLKPWHFYSHIGSKPGVEGCQINLDHSFAIAFTVEMDFTIMQSAPYGAAVMESARQYVEAGKIAVQLAASIRALGYKARAQISGNWILGPAIARDAGLGEIGRMTLLMTPGLGPRVRIGVVTTDLELVPDSSGADPSMIDFCMICKKCADNCPSNSISFGSRLEEDGMLRWKLNPESCFAYWNEMGTDCGICLAICPYSHPDNLAHNLIRWGNERSGFFRRTALKLDDLFYGRKPKRHSNPDWMVGD